MLNLKDVAPRITCVLVVDDDFDVRENLEEILEREGYTVSGASCGDQAIAHLKSAHQPCIVLLDLVMPKGDGWDVLEAILTMHELGTMTHPVIIVSGASDAKSAARMPGVVAVLTKPFEVEDLVALVREHAAPIGEQSAHGSEPQK
jgi:CheY-like chemotaxis protein